ncbi:hypothetical protein BGX38DRAFT_1181319 [Terfezia claveryi]|nr:hypothetical protein BGX38DRAFT_1181319 [Terfezia claveryi]
MVFRILVTLLEALDMANRVTIAENRPTGVLLEALDTANLVTIVENRPTGHRDSMECASRNMKNSSSERGMP